MLSPKLQSQNSTHKSGYGHVTQPPGTTEYVTSSRDTLRSVAVAFDTTTTKLMKLNKMSSLTIFPGQTLFVPCNEAQDTTPVLSEEYNHAVTPKSNSIDRPGDDFSFLTPLSPSEREFKDLMIVSGKGASKNHNDIEIKHGASAEEKRELYKLSEKHHVLKSSISHGSEDRRRVMSGESTESEPFEEGFLKMAVQYISDKNESVGGVLLVTPAALMYDPDSADPVVKRDGCDDYGIMCPMTRISSIAMYNNMKKKLQSSQKSHPLVEEGAERTRSTSNDTSTSSATTTEAEAEFNDDDELEVANLPSDETSETLQANPPAKTPFMPSKNSNTLYEIKDPVPGTVKPAELSNSVSQTLSPDGISNTDKCGKQEFQYKLENEFPFLHAVAKTVGDWIPNIYSEAKNDNTEPISETFRPSCNHMFLCIRSKQKMTKTFSTSGDEENSSPRDNTSEGSKYPEYWFQVPRKKSDLLYAFFLQWAPENRDSVADMGFIVIDDEVDHNDEDDANANKKKVRTTTNSSLEFVDDFYDESYSYEKEWEIISIQEAKRRSIAFNALELAEADDSLIPELEKPSTLLNDTTLLALCKSLPNRCIGYSWSPVYTTYDHGTSLKTLYRNMGNNEAPVVFIIRDTNDYIFGALCSSAPKVSDHYFGTGESFLFTIEPEFQVFKWTGENNFFIKGDMDSITMGGGKGTFGLWLDSDLYRGSSRPCDTFANKVLASEEDFVIQSIEVWMIKDM